MNWKGILTMRRLTASIALPLACAFVWAAVARAQGGRGAADWMTAGGDAQRSSWVRTDPKISVNSVEKPGFQVAWKIKLNSEPSVAVTLDRYIGYRGFRSLALAGSRTGEITAFDTDLGRIEWKKSLAAGATPRNAGAPCSGGMTANVARATGAGFPAMPGGRGGGGRGNAAKSAVGAPDEGAVTIAEIAARAAAAPPPGARGPVPVAAAPGAAYNPFAARASFLNAISSDGMFHSMYISNGEEPAPPVAFLPANANAHGLIVLDNVAYASTSGSCGGAPNGVWALDIASREVAHWTPDAGDVAGPAGPAFGPDETVYAATTGGELVALEPKTLHVKAAYHSGSQAFVSSPVVFEYNSESNKATMIAAPTADGRLHLVDVSSLAAASLTGAAFPAVVSGALVSWQDAAGARWLAAPSNNSIAAWKVTGERAAPVLQPGWTSREIASPLAPIVVNGVVFAVSSSSPAVLYALDGATGKELWNSGKALSAAVRNGGLSSIGSQVYLGASDGTFYAFGFPIEH
jgi:outer membrane protein assembly factor BamB